MNKFLKIAIVVVLCLIVILTVTLFACDNQSDNPGSTTTSPTTTTTTGSEPPAPSDCTEHVDADLDNKCDICGEDVADPQPPVCTEHTDADGDNICDTCGEELEAVTPDEFESVNDTVYVISIELNVRTSPEVTDDNSNLAGEIRAVYADSFNRTGYNDEWTRINIDGTDYYVKSDYVSTDKPTTEFDESAGRETVYIVNVASSIYIRSTTNLKFTANRLTSLSLGDSLVRLGVAEAPDAEGIVWAKVEITFDDGSVKVGYVNNKYLASEPEGNTDSDMGIVFESNNDILVIIAETSYTLRKYPIYADDIEKITVPNGTQIRRIGLASEVDDQGFIWSKVIYEGEIYYLSTNPTYVQVLTAGETEDKVFLFFDSAELTIPSNFVIISTTENSYILSNPEGSASVSVSYSGDVLSQGIFSTQQYVKELMTAFELEDEEPQIENGIIYFDFMLVNDESPDPENPETVYTIVAVIEGGEHDYYTFSFTELGTKDDLQAKFFEYMDSIRLVSAE